MNGKPSRGPEHEQWLRRAREVFPGGVLGSHKMPEDLQFIASHGKGSRLFDLDGREYIDYVLGSGPLILGHAHPEVVAAVQAQAARGTTFYAVTQPALLLAEKIQKAVPCAERVRFTGSGSEATFFALRLARAFTGRDKVLKFEGGYHGYHDYAILSTSSYEPSASHQAVADSAGIPAAVVQQVLVAPYNDLAATAAIIEANRASLAAVILEPLQRFLTPEPGFLQGLRDLTRRFGILLAFDEVVTGFRLAYGGAQEYYGVVPDIAAYGKTISGGSSLAAIAGRRDILDLADPGRKARGESFVHQSGTFNGNPLATAAGHATLSVLEREGTYARLYDIGRRLRDGLAQRVAAHGVRAHVLGDGPMFHVHFTERRPSNFRQTLGEDKAAAGTFAREMIRQGIFMNPGVRCYISLVHTDQDVAETLAAADRALAAVAAPARGR